MKNRRSKSLLSLAIGVSLVAVACGDDNNSTSSTAAVTTAAGATETTAASATTAATSATTAGTTGGTTAGTSAGGTSATSLKGVCPDTVVLQTDWMPEAEHGFIYQMIGAGYTIARPRHT